MKLLTLFWIALSATAADLPPPPTGMELTEPTPAMCRRTAGTPLGLSSEAVEIGMRSVQGALEGCLGDASGSLDATLVIGCDGIVASATGYDGTTIAPSAVACVLDAIHYASFAPHDMTEGQPVSVRVSADEISVYGQLANVAAAAADVATPPAQGVEEEVATLEVLIPTPMPAAKGLTATCEDFGIRERCLSTEDPEACTAWAGALLERTDTCYDGHQARQLLLKACQGISSPAQGAGCSVKSTRRASEASETEHARPPTTAGHVAAGAKMPATAGVSCWRRDGRRTRRRARARIAPTSL